jgi:hypothetical protein
MYVLYRALQTEVAALQEVCKAILYTMSYDHVILLFAVLCIQIFVPTDLVQSLH